MTWLGMDELYAALEKIAAKADAGALEIVETGSALVIRATQDDFEGSHARGEPHVGGDKPNVVTGQTRRSITADPIHRYGLLSYGTTIAPRVAWGRALELGYLTRRAFPYFAPGVERVQPQLRALGDEVWGRVVK